MRDLIDTHAHLADKKLIDDIDDILMDAGNKGVGDIISIGCSVKEAEKSLELSYIYPNVYSTSGLYPHGKKNIEESEEEQFERIAYIANEPKVVAVGECGFDFSEQPSSYKTRSKKEQEDLFRRQIELARSLDKPIVIHSRDATKDTLRVLSEEYDKSKFRAVWHCFIEDTSISEQLLKMEMMISVNGIVTYPNAKTLQETIKNTPLGSIMLETDAPYIVPQKEKDQNRKINKPEYITSVAEKISEIKGVSIGEVAEETSQNALDFFKF